MSGRIVSCVGNQAVAEMSSEKMPDLGSSVSIDGRKIGTVFDVIGNVQKPYVVVRLSHKSTRDIVGSDISCGR